MKIIDGKPEYRGAVVRVSFFPPSRATYLKRGVDDINPWH